jgi:NAD+ diphosphatase
MMIKRNEDHVIRTLGTWVIFSKSRVIVKVGETRVPQDNFTAFPFLEEYKEDIYELPPLGDSSLSSLPTFIVDLGAEIVEHDEFEAIPLRNLLFSQQDMAFTVIGRAWQYVHFLRTHRYCGQCGSPTDRIHWEMAVHCRTCNHRSYPRVSPCIIVAIHDHERILLARGVRHKEANMYSTLAGFVESGESLEEAVHREVFEEVGVKVKNIEYVDSQPWPFPHSLMVGFIAQYDGGEIRCQENEIDDAQWFDIDALPTIPPKVSIAGQLIARTVSLICDK